MANECEGTWQNSMLNGTVVDGEIVILLIADGDFIGKHSKSNKPLIGRCVGGSSPHRRFNVINESEYGIYTYTGEVVLVNDPDPIYKIRNGKRFKKCSAVRNKDAALTAPDDWTAEKPT